MMLEPLKRVLEVRKVTREEQGAAARHKRPKQQKTEGHQKKGKVDIRA